MKLDKKTTELVKAASGLSGYASGVDGLVKVFPEMRPWAEGLLKRVAAYDALADKYFE